MRLVTHAAEQARAFGALVYHEHRLRTSDAAAPFRMRLEASRFGPLVVGTLEYRAPVRIEAAEFVDSYQVNMPIFGELEMSYGAHRASVTPRCAAVHGATAPTSIEGWESPSRILGLKIPRRSMEAELTELIGEEVRRPVEFDGRLDTDSPVGRIWAALARRLVWWAKTSPTHEDFVSRTLMRSLISTVLITSPNEHSERIELALRSHRSTLRALAIMHARAASPTSVADVADELGVGVRTLEKRFGREWDRTPSEVFRTIRLSYARRELSEAEPGEIRVADVAARWGIPHPGRFASHYAELFDELPSATVARPTASHDDAGAVRPAPAPA